MVMAGDAVWISNSPKKLVHRIDPAKDEISAAIDMPGKPCSNLAAGFGSLWVPVCGDTPALARIDLKTNQITQTIAATPADSEGGITVSPDSVWMVTDQAGTLTRIDPKTNTVRAKVQLPAGAVNPLYADGLVWVTSSKTNELVAVSPETNAVVATIKVGAQPRFLTAGDGSVWTLNQGDGSVTRVDTKSRKAIATINAGIPGKGGEICYGFGAVWATLFQIPLTRVDAVSNKVTDQWVGEGGDSVRCGFDAIWLTSGKAGLLWRIPQATVRRQ
jgi:YVTN family beta-propeller protein